MNTQIIELVAVANTEAGGWNGASDGEWWWVARLLFPLIWIGVIAFLIWVFRRSGQRHEPSGMERARNVLAERYASGEIDTAEYEDRLSHLNQQYQQP